MIKILIVAICMLLAQIAAAQTCKDTISASTPDSRFVVNGDEVTDTHTGLIWQRCTLGQAGGDCSSGSANTYTWQEALQAASAPWRLPNIRELRSIVEEKCYGPAINLAIFPNTSGSDYRGSGYWSASAEYSPSYRAQIVWFYEGFTTVGDTSDGLHVRLVRDVNDKLRVGDILDTSNAGDCYCSFHPVLAGGEVAADRYLFISDSTGKAWMNINEQDVEFVVTEQCNAGSQAGLYFGFPADQQCREHATYIGAGMNVQIDLVETWHCPPEIEECEVTGFDTSIIVKKGDFQQSVKAKGTCGC